MKFLLVGIGTLAYIFFYIPFLWFMQGWTIMKLWGWFIAPQLGLPPLTLATALGIGMTITFLTNHGWQKENKTLKTEDKIFMHVNPVLRCLMAVFCGWLVHSFWH